VLHLTQEQRDRRGKKGRRKRQSIYRGGKKTAPELYLHKPSRYQRGLGTKEKGSESRRCREFSKGGRQLVKLKDREHYLEEDTQGKKGKENELGQRVKITKKEITRKKSAGGRGAVNGLGKVRKSTRVQKHDRNRGGLEGREGEKSAAKRRATIKRERGKR